MFRAVFDTVVFVRSLINPYSRWGELVFSHYDRYELFVSQPVVEEIIEVIHRPELIKKFPELKEINLERIIELIGEASLVNVPEVPLVSRDPKDNKFLATADASKAHYLVTEDADLLILKEYKGTKIVDTLTFLRVLAKS